LILIIAGSADPAAADLALRWHAAGARCVRPADLSVPGWRHYVATERGRDCVVAGGTRIPASEVRGVLTRITWISPAELPVIAEADRSYVATEMSAFLLSWLAAFDRPVVNRPTPGCLSGPPWRAPQWIAAALSVGLRIKPADDTPPRNGATVYLTVVGDRCFGSAAAELHAAALRLATIATTQLLGVAFDSDRPDAAFLGATAFPPLDAPDVADTLLAVLQSSAQPKSGLPVMRPWRFAQPPP
jgi:hypothetical protein